MNPALLIPLIMGGGLYAAKRAENRGSEEKEAAEKQLEQLQKSDLEYQKSKHRQIEDRQKAQMEEEQRVRNWERLSALVQANPQWGIKLPERPITEAEAAQTAITNQAGAIVNEALQQRSTQQPERFKAEAQGITPLTAQNEAVDAPETVPGIPQTLFSINIKSSGDLDIKIDQNMEFHKNALNQYAANLYAQEFEKHRKAGETPNKANEQASLAVLTKLGMTDNYENLTELFKDMSPERKYNFAHQNILYRISQPDSLGTFEDLRAELSDKYPFNELTGDQWETIKKDVYNKLRVINYPAARQIVKNKYPDMDVGGDEFKETAEIEASRLASGIMGAPNLAEGMRIQRYKEQLLERETAARKFGTLAEEQAYAAQLLIPDIEEITKYSTALNTVEGLERLGSVVGLNLAAFLQWGAGKKVKIDGKSIDIGVAAKFYKDKIEKYLATFARIFGERGVLTEQDVKRAARGFARLGASKTLTGLKNEDMRKHFEEMNSRDPLLYKREGGTIRATQNTPEAYEKLIKEILENEKDVGPLNEKFPTAEELINDVYGGKEKNAE